MTEPLESASSPPAHQPLPQSRRPFSTDRPKPAVPCLYCTQPFPTASLLQAHLELDHGQKRKKVKPPKLKKEEGYMPARYNPADGFLPAVGIGVLAVVGLALIAPTAVARYGVLVAVLGTLAAKYGFFNK